MVASTSTYNKVIVETSIQMVVTAFSIDLVISWATMSRIATRTSIYPIHTLLAKDQIRHIFSKYLIVYEKIMRTSLYKILMIGSNYKSFPFYYIFTIFKGSYSRRRTLDSTMVCSTFLVESPAVL